MISIEEEVLFARNSKGEIKIWRIRLVGAQFGYNIVINFGIGFNLNVNTHEHSEYISTGKNLSKGNATNPLTQATKQLTARIKKQKKIGYKSLADLNLSIEEVQENPKLLDERLPINNTNDDDNIIPMKAMPYFKESKSGVLTPRIKFPCYSQPKVNGVRCFMRWVDGKAILYSKKGLIYKLPHITDNVAEYMFNSLDCSDIIYDGELYIPNMILGEIVHHIKTPSMWTAAVEYHVFDLAIPDIDQGDRIKILHGSPLSVIMAVKIIESQTCNNHEEAIRLRDEYIAAGYEGAIFRDPDVEYGFGKRPPTMTKFKKSIEKEYKIVQVIGQEKRPELGMFVCTTGTENFVVNPEGSEATKRKYLEDFKNLIGKMLTVRFFEYTDKGIPFHAVGVTVRDYE